MKQFPEVMANQWKADSTRVRKLAARVIAKRINILQLLCVVGVGLCLFVGTAHAQCTTYTFTIPLVNNSCTVGTSNTIYGTDTGTDGTNYVITSANVTNGQCPASGFGQGDMAFFYPAHANSTAIPTLSVCGSTAADIRVFEDAGLHTVIIGQSGSDLNTSVMAQVMWDGTRWELLNGETYQGTVQNGVYSNNIIPKWISLLSPDIGAGSISDTGSTTHLGVTTAGVVSTPSVVKAPALIDNGTKFTSSGGCSEAGSLIGGSTTGAFTAGATACTTTITIGGSIASANGWICVVYDETTPAKLVQVTADTTTTVTFSGTVSSGDVIKFSCRGY